MIPEALLNGVQCTAEEYAKNQPVATKRHDRSLSCLFCKEPILFVNGEVNAAHFRHLPATSDSADCPLRDSNHKEYDQIIANFRDNFHARLNQFVLLPHRIQRYQTNGLWRDALNAKNQSISFRACESTVDAESDIAILDLHAPGRLFGGLQQVNNKLFVKLRGCHELFRIKSKEIILDGGWNKFLRIVTSSATTHDNSDRFEIELWSVPDMLERVFTGIANPDVDTKYRTEPPDIPVMINCDEHGLHPKNPVTDVCSICYRKETMHRQQERLDKERERAEHERQARIVRFAKERPIAQEYADANEPLLREGLQAALSALMDSSLNPKLKPSDRQDYKNTLEFMITEPDSFQIATFRYFEAACNLIPTTLRSRRPLVQTTDYAQAVLEWVKNRANINQDDDD